MAKVIFSPNQKQEVLLKLSEGCKARDISQEHGVSVRTLYRWRSKMLKDTPRGEESQRLRSLEFEHRRLQQRFAELALDYSTLRAALLKDTKADC